MVGPLSFAHLRALTINRQNVLANDEIEGVRQLIESANQLIRTLYHTEVDHFDHSIRRLQFRNVCECIFRGKLTLKF